MGRRGGLREVRSWIGDRLPDLVLGFIGAIWWIVPLGLLLWFALQALTFTGEACASSEGPTTAEPRGPAPDEPITLAIAAGGEALDVVIPNQHVITRSISLIPSQPVPQGTVLRAGVEGDLVRADRAAIFSQEQVVPRLDVAPDGNQITLVVCFAGSSPHQVDPGKYEGAIRIRGSVIEPVSIPVLATVRYPNGWIAWIVAFLSVGLGLLAKGLGEIGARREEATVDRSSVRHLTREQRIGKRRTLLQELADYFREPLTVVSAILGFGLAAYAVFTLYLANPTFGGPQDWVTLSTFCFLSLVGGFTIAEFAAAIGQTAPPRRTGPASRQPQRAEEPGPEGGTTRPD